jgi:hypothetical protein
MPETFKEAIAERHNLDESELKVEAEIPEPVASAVESVRADPAEYGLNPAVEHEPMDIVMELVELEIEIPETE